MLDEEYEGDGDADQGEPPQPHIARDQLLIVGAAVGILLAPMAIGSLWQSSAFGWLSLAILAVELTLPLAALYGSRGLSRESRGLIAALVVWAWLVPSLRLLPPEWLSWGPWMEPTTEGLVARFVQLAFLVLADVAPLLVVGALALRRETEAVWPRPLVFAAAGLAAILALNAARNTLGWTAGYPAELGYAASPASNLLAAARSAVGPLWPLSLSGLLWFAWSGVRAGEWPLAFWRLLALGSGALLVAWLLAFGYDLGWQIVVTISLPSEADVAGLNGFLGLVSVIMRALTIGGYLALAAAFGRYLPPVREVGAPDGVRVEVASPAQ